MNHNWNLSSIYPDFTGPVFQNDLKDLQSACAHFDTFVGKISQLDPATALREGIGFLEKISYLGRSLSEYASLRQSADTSDAEAATYLGQVMAEVTKTAGAETEFYAFAAGIPRLEEIIQKDEVLREYEFFFRKIKENSRYRMSGQAETVMARMSLSGGDAWADLQEALTSSLKVEYGEKVTTLSEIRGLAYDKNPEVRKSAYEAELRSYEKISEPVAFALNSVKLETLNEAALRGYESPLDLALRESDMKRETLDAMFAAIDRYLPKFWQYLRVKAKTLGYENGLPWYELYAPMGKEDRTYTIEEAQAYILDLFSRFDPELHDLALEAFTHDWIDYDPRAGKCGGAFCAQITKLGEARILTNFTGKFTDIVTLAHELGHAFHDRQIRNHRVLNQDYSMPVAETASTFNECIVMAKAIQDAASQEEKLALVESQLQDATAIICDIYSRFMFESEVFRLREKEFLPAERLCSLMTEAQKKAYGDGLDHDVLHPYMWVNKSHYYGSVYYNFPYAFGGLFARGLYAQYEKEGEAFLPKYKKLLHETTVSTAEQTAAAAGIDLTSQAFWEQGLGILSDEIDIFISLLEESNNG